MMAKQIPELTAKDLVPLLADLKKGADYLTTWAENADRDIHSIIEVLTIHSENIRLLVKGFKEISESEDGRNNYLSSTLKEIKSYAKAKHQGKY